MSKRLSPEYIAYMRSPEWDAVRKRALSAAKYKCKYRSRFSKCSGPLQVHHKTYKNLFHERPEDLEVVCKKHHRWADIRRKIRKAVFGL
jgi:hypothetical protein